MIKIWDSVYIFNKKTFRHHCIFSKFRITFFSILPPEPDRSDRKIAVAKRAGRQNPDFRVPDSGIQKSQDREKSRDSNGSNNGADTISNNNNNNTYDNGNSSNDDRNSVNNLHTWLV